MFGRTTHCRVSPKMYHCISDNQEKGIRIGPNWDLSKALNNRYRLRDSVTVNKIPYTLMTHAKPNILVPKCC